ncbi:hypothetical protein ACFLQ2_05175 [archaeon]
MVLEYRAAKTHYKKALEAERKFWKLTTEERGQWSLDRKIKREMDRSQDALQLHIQELLAENPNADEREAVAKEIAEKVLADAKVKGFDNAFNEHYGNYNIRLLKRKS